MGDEVSELKRKLAEAERRTAEEAAAREASDLRAAAAERRAAAAEAAARGIEAVAEVTTLEAVQQRFKSLKLGSPSKATGDVRVFRRELSALLNEQPLTLGISLPPDTLAEVFKAVRFDDEPSEAVLYPLATYSVPACVNAQRRTPGAKQNAEAVFGPRDTFELPEHVWLPLNCEPELFVTVKEEGDDAYAGEQKRLQAGTFNELMTYVLLGISHSAFRVGATRGRRFHAKPPVGYGLLACGHVGFLLGVEWVGKLMVYHVSQPFFLGSREHAAAVSALPVSRLPMQEAVVVPHTGGAWRTHPPVGDPLVAWTAQAAPGGRFWKIIQCTAYDKLPADGGVARLRSLHTVYKRYAAALDAATPHDPVPTALLQARLLYGAFELLVDMPFVGGREATPDELALNDLVADAVAAAVAWLARRGLLYVDLRPPNVRVQGGLTADPTEAWLVDYDDMVVLESPAQRAADVVHALRANTYGKQALAQFSALEAALLRTPWPVTVGDSA